MKRSRTLPWAVIVNVPRFGHGLRDDMRETAIAALAELARKSRRFLRVNVEVFSPDTHVRESIGRCLHNQGFHRADTQLSYSDTLVIDLSPPEDRIFSTLPSKTRRDIRIIGKHPVKLQPITDKMLTPRMEQLLGETLARTGEPYQPPNFESIIDLSNHVPTLSRLVGLFRTQSSGPDALLAFAWGCGHVDHAEYKMAASTRMTDLKIPLGYALLWNLISWARGNGATWFDLGGVTDGHLGSGDPMGGISDFKRYFSTRAIRVGDNWVLEPHRLQATVARCLSTAFNRISQATHARTVFPGYS